MNKYQALVKKYTAGQEMPDFTVRHLLTKKYSWAIPSDEALETISKYSPLVEVGCGSAYWAHLLQQIGCTILPLEKYIKNNSYGHKKFWTDVYKGDEEVLEKLAYNVNLFLCWPPYNEPMAYNCLMKFKGRYVIYVGECSYGCTGDDDFHDELDTHWENIKTVYIPTWFGVYDTLNVYKRK